MHNKIDFSAFSDDVELERWLRFNESYNKLKNKKKTTNKFGYKNPLKHKDKIIRLMELIKKYGNTYFRFRRLSKLEKPNNPVSFSAQMRYAMKYLNEIGIISIYNRKTRGRKQTTYKREIDIETMETLIDVMKEHKDWC